MVNTPATYNITIRQGATFSLPLTIRQTTGSPRPGVDLSQATITARVYKQQPDPKIEDLNIQGTFVTTPSGSPELSEGQFTITLSSTQTESLDLEDNVGWWDVEINYGGSPPVIDIAVEGRVTLRRR